MQEHFRLEARNGSIGPSLRAVERTTEDGYRIQAGLYRADMVHLRLDQTDGTHASDVLNAEERIALAKLLLTGLPIDAVRDALPTELFTAEWALQGADGQILGEAEGGATVDRAAAEVALDDLEDDSISIVRRDVSTWAPVD